MNKLNPIFRDCLLFLCVAVAVPLVAAWELRSSDESMAVVIVSSLFCLLAINLYFAFQLRTRKKRVGQLISGKFWLGIIALTIFSGIVTAGVSSYVSAHQSYLALTLSNEPLREIYPERKRLVVELMRKTLANSRENDKVIAEARQHPLSPALFSPGSFATKAVIDSVKGQLRNVVEMDHNYFLKQRQAMAEFEEKMAKVDPAYLQSWETSRRREDETEAATDQLQMDWFDQTNSLYDYAETHLDEITVKSGALVFINKGTQEAFNTQENKCKTLFEKLQSRVQKEAKAHRKPTA